MNEIKHEGNQTLTLEADVWALDESDNGKTLRLRVHDDIKIRLPENPTTGYLWNLDKNLISKQGFADGVETEDNEYPLQLLDCEFEMDAATSGGSIVGLGEPDIFQFGHNSPVAMISAYLSDSAGKTRKMRISSG